MDKVLRLHKISCNLHERQIPLLPSLINRVIIRMLFACQIGVGTKIGENVSFGYGGLGVVIHDRAVIGDNVQLGTCITIGGNKKEELVPIIGDNTIISTGAVIIGPIKVGKNCVIGANAVVVNDIPDYSVAVGAPAKVVKSGINIEDY